MPHISAEAERLAKRFHETYERLAPSFGYETRKASAKPWAEVPKENRDLMTAVCSEILAYVSERFPLGRIKDRDEPWKTECLEAIAWSGLNNCTSIIAAVAALKNESALKQLMLDAQVPRLMEAVQDNLQRACVAEVALEYIRLRLQTFITNVHNGRTHPDLLAEMASAIKADVPPLRSASEVQLREAWEAGITLARSYRDNIIHLAGEQKERQWQRFLNPNVDRSPPAATPAKEE